MSHVDKWNVTNVPITWPLRSHPGLSSGIDAISSTNSDFILIKDWTRRSRQRDWLISKLIHDWTLTFLSPYGVSIPRCYLFNTFQVEYVIDIATIIYYECYPRGSCFYLIFIFSVFGRFKMVGLDCQQWNAAKSRGVVTELYPHRHRGVVLSRKLFVFHPHSLCSWRPIASWQA